MRHSQAHLHQSTWDEHAMGFAKEVGKVRAHERQAEDRDMHRSVLEGYVGHVTGCYVLVGRNQVEGMNLLDRKQERVEGNRAYDLSQANKGARN